jgi:hypothetical protein
LFGSSFSNGAGAIVKVYKVWVINDTMLLVFSLRVAVHYIFKIPLADKSALYLKEFSVKLSRLRKCWLDTL